MSGRKQVNVAGSSGILAGFAGNTKPAQPNRQVLDKMAFRDTAGRSLNQGAIINKNVTLGTIAVISAICI
jgi:hypothetical protein